MFWVWPFWLISLRLSPLHAFLVVPYVIVCDICIHMLHCLKCVLLWIDILTCFVISCFLLSKPSYIYRYCIHIDSNPFSAAPNRPLLRSVPFPRQFAADALRRAVFSLSLQGIWVVCFAEISVPKAWGSSTHSKGKSTKRNRDEICAGIYNSIGG